LGPIAQLSWVKIPKATFELLKGLNIFIPEQLNIDEGNFPLLEMVGYRAGSSKRTKSHYSNLYWHFLCTRTEQSRFGMSHLCRLIIIEEFIMRNKFGLTIIELMIVTAIISITAGIAIPNMVSARNDSKYRGAITNIKSDLNMARSVAVREGGFIAVQFYSNGYQIFIDNGATEGNFDPGERMLTNLLLPSGVSIDLNATTFTNNRLRFNDRGLPENLGSAMVLGANGAQQSIQLNRLGRIWVNK
jgi:prepilin-type N-terminal cleavage/methylation domain-containing protein